MSLPDINDIDFLSEMLDWTNYDVDALGSELDNSIDTSAYVQPQTIAEDTIQTSSMGTSDDESPAFTRPVFVLPSEAYSALTTKTRSKEYLAFVDNDIAHGPQSLSEHFSSEERAWTDSSTLDTYLSGSFNTQ